MTADNGNFLQKNLKLYLNQFFLILIQVKIIEKAGVLRATVPPSLKFLQPGIGSMPK
jgi:hypothetical protein